MEHKSLARKTDPETSHIAAQALEASGKLSDHQAKVLSALKTFIRRRGFYPTSAELAHDSGIDHQIVWKRLPDLRKKNLVENDIIMGQQVKRVCRIKKTKGITWKIKEGKNG